MHDSRAFLELFTSFSEKLAHASFCPHTYTSHPSDIKSSDAGLKSFLLELFTSLSRALHELSRAFIPTPSDSKSKSVHVDVSRAFDELSTSYYQL
jgi:hypothetical protein